MLPVSDADARQMYLKYRVRLGVVKAGRPGSRTLHYLYMEELKDRTDAVPAESAENPGERITLKEIAMQQSLRLLKNRMGSAGESAKKAGYDHVGQLLLAAREEQTPDSSAGKLIERGVATMERWRELSKADMATTSGKVSVAIELIRTATSGMKKEDFAFAAGAAREAVTGLQSFASTQIERARSLFAKKEEEPQAEAV